MNFGSALSFWAAAVLFLSIFWPRYGYFAVGPLPQITPFTAVAVLSWVFLPLLLITSPAVAGKFLIGVRQHRGAILAFVAWYIFRFVSDALGEDPENSILITTRELVYLGVILPLSLATFCSEGGLKRIFRVIVVATAVVIFLGVLEAAVRKPLVQIFSIRFDGDARSVQNLVTSEMRGGIFRLKSTFTHPIVFGQYLAWTFPVLFAIVRIDRSFFIRMLAVVSMALTPWMIWGTASRAAILGLIVSTTAYAAIAFIRKVGLRSRGGALAIIGLLLALVLAIGPGQALLGDLVAGRNAAEASSTSYRRAMFEKGFEAITASPLLGFGDGRAVYHAGFAGANGSLSIDSLYLSTLLASGWIGVAFLVGLFLYALKILGGRLTGGGGSDLDVALLAGTVALAATFSILSIGDNLTLLFLTLGVGMVPRVRASGSHRV